MIELYRGLIARQFEAAFCMLGACVERCLEDRWHEPVASLKFCQAAFHVLFYTDTYLSTTWDEVPLQGFHLEHQAIFGDYEETKPKVQQAVYTKDFVRSYLRFCREKAARVMAAETEETLARNPGFDWLKFSRAEVHVYNIRHIQHHAAQLSLRLRLDIGDGIPWVGSGWRELTP